jgi:hypothetical protein
MKQRDLLLLLVPFFIMVVAWVIFNIYHSSVTSTISDTLNIQIAPINPTFDKKAIEEIKNRDDVQPIYDLSNSSLATPAPTATPTPTATTSGLTLQTESNESSSEGGELSP